MKRKKYTFVYSGQQEWTKCFNKLSTLKKFLNTVPDWELNNTKTVLERGKNFYIGKYYLLKKGGLSVKF